MSVYECTWYQTAEDWNLEHCLLNVAAYNTVLFHLVRASPSMEPFSKTKSCTEPTLKDTPYTIRVCRFLKSWPEGWGEA